MLRPKKKMKNIQKHGIYRAENRQNNMVYVFIKLRIQNCLGICFLYTLRKFSIIIYSRNRFMTFTFWLFRAYIKKRYIYGIYAGRISHSNCANFAQFIWHLKTTVNYCGLRCCGLYFLLLWISMRVHIFHAIFIYISITKCPPTRSISLSLSLCIYIDTHVVSIRFYVVY